MLHRASRFCKYRAKGPSKSHQLIFITFMFFFFFEMLIRFWAFSTRKKKTLNSLNFEKFTSATSCGASAIAFPWKHFRNWSTPISTQTCTTPALSFESSSLTSTCCAHCASCQTSCDCSASWWDDSTTASIVPRRTILPFRNSCNKLTNPNVRKWLLWWRASYKPGSSVLRDWKLPVSL